MAPFIDDLALVEALLVFAGVVLTYLGVSGWWAMRKGDAKGLRDLFKGAAIPVGLTGGVMLVIALWGEMTWPFPPAYMGGYDIFFQDAMLMFGLVMVSFALTAYYSLSWQYMAIFALTVGAVTMFYGWTAYTANVAYTKDPYTTYLMYMGFGAAGIAAFPTGIIVDLYLAAAEGRSTFWTSVTNSTIALRTPLGIRGVGSMKDPVETTPKSTVETPSAFRLPWIAQLVILAFPLFMGLATFAALAYFGTTLPGHLIGGPGKAP